MSREYGQYSYGPRGTGRTRRASEQSPGLADTANQNSVRTIITDFEANLEKPLSPEATAVLNIAKELDREFSAISSGDITPERLMQLTNLWGRFMQALGSWNGGSAIDPTRWSNRQASDFFYDMRHAMAFIMEDPFVASGELSLFSLALQPPEVGSATWNRYVATVQSHVNATADMEDDFAIDSPGRNDEGYRIEYASETDGLFDRLMVTTAPLTPAITINGVVITDRSTALRHLHSLFVKMRNGTITKKELEELVKIFDATANNLTVDEKAELTSHMNIFLGRHLYIGDENKGAIIDLIRNNPSEAVWNEIVNNVNTFVRRGGHIIERQAFFNGEVAELARSNPSFRELLLEITELMEMVRDLLTELRMGKKWDDLKLGKLLAAIDNVMASAHIRNLGKQVEALEKQASMKFWMKFGTILASVLAVVISGIITFCTFGAAAPFTAALIVLATSLVSGAMIAIEQTGAMNKMLEGIDNPHVRAVVKAIIEIAVAVILAVITCGIASSSLAVKIGEVVTAKVLRAVIVSSVVSVSSAVIMATCSGIVMGGGLKELAKLFAGSKEEAAKWQMALEILVMLVGIVASLGASALGAKHMPEDLFKEIARGVLIGGTLINAAGKITLAIPTIISGNILLKEVAPTQQKEGLIKAFQEVLKMIQEILKGETEESDALFTELLESTDMSVEGLRANLVRTSRATADTIASL